MLKILKDTCNSDTDLGYFYLKIYHTDYSKVYCGKIYIEMFFNKFTKRYNSYYFDSYLKEYYGLEKFEFLYIQDYYDNYLFVDSIILKDINRYNQMLKFNRNLKLNKLLFTPNIISI